VYYNEKKTGSLPVNINYAEYCSDPESRAKTLVLVHGLSSKHRTWKEVAPLLAEKGYYVLAPDLPNHGLSDDMKGEKQIRDYADAIYSWTEQLKLESAVFVTSSWGSVVGTELSKYHPDFVKGLFVSAPIYGLEDVPLGKQYSIIRPLLKTLPIDILKFIKNFQAYFRSKTKKEREIYLRSSNYSLQNDIVIQLGDATKQFTPYLPPSVPFAMENYQKISPKNRIQFFKVKNSGHHIQREAPRAFAKNVLKFLENVHYISSCLKEDISKKASEVLVSIASPKTA
jgi:pimeloyl-ACP methyl ester carboxylesterase